MMYMSWQFYLVLSILFLSMNGLFHRSLMREDKSNPIVQAIVFLSISGIIATIIAYCRGVLAIQLNINYLIIFLFIGIASAMGYFLKYSGFKTLGASEVVILASTTKLWNVFGASIFLGEELTYKKIAGTLIIILGAAFVVYKNGSFKINSGTIFVLISAILFAFADILGYKVLNDIEASNFQIYFYFLPVIALLIAKPDSIGKFGYYFKATRAIRVVALGLLDTLGMLLLFIAYQAGGPASIIAPLSATKIIVTVFLAMIILREKENYKSKIIGSVVATVGVVLLL